MSDVVITVPIRAAPMYAVITSICQVTHGLQDMYDKQRGRKRGMGSDADSDGDQLGFGSSRPRKEIMCEEQVAPPHMHAGSLLSQPQYYLSPGKFLLDECFSRLAFSRKLLSQPLCPTNRSWWLTGAVGGWGPGGVRPCCGAHDTARQSVF